MATNNTNTSLSSEQKVALTTLKDDFYILNRKYPDLSYYGNIPAQYSENTTSWIQWMHWMEGWISTVNDNLNIINNDLNAFIEKYNAFLILVQDKLQALSDRDDEIVQDYTDKINNIIGTAITITPKVIASLDELNSQFPHGDEGVYVAADDGHKYVWVNGKWTDAGVYQSAVLGDRLVKANNVDYLNFENIEDNLILDNDISLWNTTTASFVVSNHNIDFNGIKYTDTGILIKVNARNILQDNENYYINFDYLTSRIGDVNKDKISLYLFNDQKDFFNGQKNPFGAVYQTENQLHGQFAVNNAFFGVQIPKTFYLLIATQTDYKLSVKNLKLNKTNYYENFGKELKQLNVDHFRNNGVSWEKIGTWNTNSNDSYKILSDNSLFFKRGSTSGNSGITFDVEADTTEDIYVTTNIVSKSYGVWIMNTAGNLLYDLSGSYTLRSYGDIKIFKVSQQMIKLAGLTNNTIRILVSVGGQNTVNIFSIAVSNQIGDPINKNTMNKVIENNGFRATNFIGQQTENVPKLANVNYAGVMYGGYKRLNSIDGIVKDIIAYAPTDGTYKFKIANLDQYNLIVNSTDFNLTLKSGLNKIDVEKNNLAISKNQMVLMDLSAAGIYTPDSIGIFEPTILQDSAHTVNETGHSGNNLFDSDKIVPFSYSVIENTNVTKLNKISDEIVEINYSIGEILPLKNGVTITAPNGIKFKIIVDNNGNLSTINTVPSKVVIAGNSLTFEKGNIGMAASDGNHDYYQLIKNYIKNANPNAIINDRFNFSVWEMVETTDARNTLFNDRLKPLLSSDTDLVIIQLGDNVNTTERHATFANDVNQLIKNIKSVSPHATIMWVAAWFISFDTLIDEIKSATSANGAVMVDITEYRSIASNQSYIGATRTGLDGTSWQVTTQGEASHPGDAGMLKIAQKIESLFEF